jgi:hypothetical protein
MSKEFMTDLKIKYPRFHVMPELDFGIPWGFFDGVCQGNPPICGVGEVLYLKQNHYIQVRYAPWKGTNNKEEFISLCTLLEATSKKYIKKLQLWGNPS